MWRPTNEMPHLCLEPHSTLLVSDVNASAKQILSEYYDWRDLINKFTKHEIRLAGKFKIKFFEKNFREDKIRCTYNHY